MLYAVLTGNTKWDDFHDRWWNEWHVWRNIYGVTDTLVRMQWHRDRV